MLITLHCGGLPFDGTTIENKSLGGSESAAYYMARELAKAGHRVTLFTNTDKESVTDGVRYVPCGNMSEQYPMGDLFHYYAENTPTDVMIIQRHPKAFDYRWASKINLWWVHDLALYRNKAMVNDMMINIDGVLTVSQWHKDQVAEVYSINPDIIYPITNGVDLSLFDKDGVDDATAELLDHPFKDETFFTKLIYSSRPERGLENLVKPDGIMERLHAIDKNYHLYVCGYDNVTPDMRDYYSALYSRCDQLPNVTHLGALTKQELADVMRQCDLHVYPSTFEETSCITAMECMAAGLPMVASNVGALPETVERAGVSLIDLIDDKINIKKFVREITRMDIKDVSSEKQLTRAHHYSWAKACHRLLGAVEWCFKKAQSSDEAMVRHLIDQSDYYAAKEIELPSNPISISLREELAICYGFTKDDVWDEHYAKYYLYEDEKGANYGPEDLSNNNRYLHVASIIASLPAGSTVLDYGCAHGHFTNNLAKANPDKRFVGIDITESNIDIARKWAEDEGLKNATFACGRVVDGSIKFVAPIQAEDPLPTLVYDVVIAAEVLEHVADPGNHVNVLQQYLKQDGLMLLTTPYGPWEAQGYKKEWPWRAHVHHLEREDLMDLWGNNDDFHIVNVPAGHTKEGKALGSYITTWGNTSLPSGSIDYARKLNTQAPRQTLSVCMIVKDSLSSIRRCLESVMHIADELIIRLDVSSHGAPNEFDSDVEELIYGYMRDNWPEKAFVMNYGPSPTQLGFDAARNETLKKASGDWIMWIDADEYLHNPEHVVKYLRNNQYNGYAVPQHHFSMQPVGIQKTDLPVRLFRNHAGIKFFGKVHEHPEQELNKGVGYVTVVNDFSILHDGYKDESVRRERFNRNIDLLVQDRKENPDRILGKFLWIRDLAQMSEWELQDNGGHITPVMQQRADQGIELWRELLAGKDLRIAVDSLSFYSALSHIKGGGFDMEVQLDTNQYGHAHASKMKPVHAYFNNKEDASTLMNLVFEERTKQYGSRYQ